MGSMRTSMQQLPEEILFHLPVKSLLKSKCVSKRWYSLISSKEFIRRHSKKSSTYMSHHKLIVLNSKDDIKHSFRSCSLRSLVEKSSITSFDHHPMDYIHDQIPRWRFCYDDDDYDIMTAEPLYDGDDGNPNGGFGILGSCNGLILIAIEKRNFLWNPSTREAKKITPPTSHAGSKFRRIRRRSFLYGLGYDDSNDDYKIVGICLSNHQPITTDMYSWRTNSWKKIENFDNGFDCSKNITNGKFVNGKLHWLTHYDCDRGGNNIVALDLAEEKYEIVGLPKNHPHYQPRLHVLGGYLSLTSFDENFCNMDVWIMTKYGEMGSWVKVWTLYEEKMTCGMFLCPLWLTMENGDVVMSYAKSRGLILEVVVYNESNVLHKSRVDTVAAANSSNQDFDEVFADDFDGGNFDANIYFETLVSPFF